MTPFTDLYAHCGGTLVAPTTPACPPVLPPPLGWEWQPHPAPLTPGPSPEQGQTLPQGAGPACIQEDSNIRMRSPYPACSCHAWGPGRALHTAVPAAPGRPGCLAGCESTVLGDLGLGCSSGSWAPSEGWWQAQHASGLLSGAAGSLPAAPCPVLGQRPQSHLWSRGSAQVAGSVCHWLARTQPVCSTGSCLLGPCLLCRLVKPLLRPVGVLSTPQPGRLPPCPGGPGQRTPVT